MPGGILVTKKATFHVSLDPEVKRQLDAMALDTHNGNASALLSDLVSEEHRRREARRQVAEALPLEQERVSTIWVSLPRAEPSAPFVRAARALYPKAERILSRQKPGHDRGIEITVGTVPVARGEGFSYTVFPERAETAPADRWRVLATERAIEQLAEAYAQPR